MSDSFRVALRVAQAGFVIALAGCLLGFALIAGMRERWFIRRRETAVGTLAQVHTSLSVQRLASFADLSQLYPGRQHPALRCPPPRDATGDRRFLP